MEGSTEALAAGPRRCPHAAHCGRCRRGLRAAFRSPWLTLGYAKLSRAARAIVIGQTHPAHNPKIAYVSGDKCGFARGIRDNRAGATRLGTILVCLSG